MSVACKCLFIYVYLYVYIRLKDDKINQLALLFFCVNSSFLWNSIPFDNISRTVGSRATGEALASPLFDKFV